MGLFAFLSGRKPPRRASNENSHRWQAAAERLEQRILFAVQVNTNAFDTVAPSGGPAGDYADQAETTNVTFSMPGSSADQLAVAYKDGAMQRFGQHLSDWSFSTDGGQSFAQPSDDPANPALLPTVYDGTQNTTDDTNDILAWDNANATLYMASTSFPTRSDINVYQSTDGGQTFTAGVDATPDAPTIIGVQPMTYDKPWLAADNYPGAGDGTGYGALYLAYVQNLGGQNQIVITGVGPGASFTSASWPKPQNSGAPPGSVVATGLVQSPEIVVEPDHSVDVVYMAEVNGECGIYLVHSGSPLSSNGWANPQAKELASYQQVYPGFPFDNIDVYLDDGSGNHPPSLVDIPPYPSVAIGTIPDGDTYLYCAYMDGNLDGNNVFDGTFGIYEFQYDLTTRPTVNPSGPFSPIARDDGVITNEWMPSIAVSPDGRYAFIGFYGGNGSYDPVSTDPPSGYVDQQYNMFYVAGSTSASGTNWGSVTQITNVDSSGQPTGGYMDQPNGPNLYGAGGAGQEWFSDYDSASADYQNFHYSFMGTSDEQVTGSDGSQVTLQDQTDIYMSNIAIPYAQYMGNAPPVPTNVAFAANTDQYEGTTFTVNWDGTGGNPYPNLPDAYAYVEYSVAGQGWLPFGTRTPAVNGFLTLQSDDPSFPNYSPDTTYYFRVRMQYLPEPDNNFADASSGWSSVFVAPGSNTMVITGTPGNHTIVMTDDPVHDQIDYTIDGNAQPAVPIISGGSLLVLGGGGADQITFNLSNGNFLAAETDIDNDGGTLKLDIVGTTSNDTVSIVGGGNAPYTFDGTNVNVIAGLIESLEYDDGGGNDTTNEMLGVTGMIPVMLNLSSGDSTNAITNSDSSPVYVVPGTGKIALTAAAGPTVITASTADTGIRDLYFSAINISAGAFVVFANTSATFGDYSNHANRTLAIVDADGLNIAPGGTLDIGDNSMLLKYSAGDQAATDTMVNDLLTSGCDGGAWDGTGITSSEANYDAIFGASADGVGWADQNDVGDVSFEGDTADIADGNEVMIKFTYYGDTDLSGTVDSTDTTNFSFGLHGAGNGGNAGWEFGDFDYSGGKPNSSDNQLFGLGFHAYRAFGAL